MAYVVITIILLLSALILWKLPIWQLKGRTGLTKNEILTLENEFRKTIAQILGGLFVLCGLYFTWNQLSATRESISISQQTSLTERYSKAIDQLGNSNPQIRLGGIFALEKLASSSNEYISVVNEVLATYIRQKSRDTNSYTREEVQAAIRIISFREANRNYLIDEEHGVNISHSSLRALNFDNSKLAHAKFIGSDLRESTLADADLSNVSGMDADFSKTNLTNCDLSQSNFYGANFDQSVLKKSIFTSANFQLSTLREADLSYCIFDGTDLSDADLNGTILYGANLSKAKGLTKKQIEKARTNNITILPLNLK